MTCYSTWRTLQLEADDIHIEQFSVSYTYLEQGCQGQEKVREISVFLRVREKWGNFAASQGIL